jgi:hypothetical protein
MMTPEDRTKLRDAALTAVNGTRARSNVAHAALAADWKLWTSNSFRRIGAHGDGDVLCGTKHPLDGQPDLLAAPGVLDYMIAAQPRVVIQLLDDVAALEDKLAKARVVSDKIEDVERRLNEMAAAHVAALDAVVTLLGDTSDAEAVTRARALIDQLIGALRGDRP